VRDSNPRPPARHAGALANCANGPREEDDTSRLCHTAPVDHRSIARITAAGRVAIGTALLVVPRAVTRGWIGEAGGAPGAKLLARGVGGRDLILGLGVINALDRGDPRAQDWVRASALADGADAVATVLAFRHLPRRARFGVLLLAGGAAVTGFVAADNLD
jgi:hypothetical protein